MNNRKCLALLMVLLSCVLPVAARQFESALPGYKFAFPRDHASHENYKTEWWYYTGHLVADDKTKYGYELTFFRVGQNVTSGVKSGPWNVDNLYMAHFAVSDMTGKKFFHDANLTRGGVNFAGANSDRYAVWNKNWIAKDIGKAHQLIAKSGDYAIDLIVTPTKRPVVHGKDGISQKASCVGCASHYYSLTRLATEGTISVGKKKMKVSGVSWMDHEFGSNQLSSEQMGWDWFSIQLDDNSELMLYCLRRRDRTIDPNSSGTVITAKGADTHIPLSDFKITPTGFWTSDVSNAEYPMGWHVTVPKLSIDLNITPEMKNQELVKKRESDVTYWEGACTVIGTAGGKPVTGQAYVEMTGYAKSGRPKI